ncbi:MAG: ABC transporter substrate-binding protein [Casimicrobium sp.]
MLVSIRAVALAFVWTAISGAVAQTPPVSPDRIRIHHVSVLSGVLAGPNSEALSGAKLAIDAVNQAGGVYQRQIEIVSVDDRQDPRVTEQQASDLIKSNEVLAFFLPRTSPSLQALHKLTETAGIPIVAPQIGPDFAYAPTQQTIFSVRASYATELTRAIDLQYRLGRRSFAFLAADDAFGNPLVATATQRLSELGLKPIAIEKIDNRDPKVGAALDTFSRLKPETVYLLCAAKCAAEFVNGLSARQVQTQFVALSNNSSNSFIKSLGPNARGVIVMQVTPPPSSKTARVAKAYAMACSKAGIEPSYAGLVGYIGAHVLVEGLKRAGKNLSSRSLIRGLESIKSIDLGDFAISYGVNDRIGSLYVEETMIGRNGTFVR